MRQVNIGIIGLGTVGAGAIDIVRTHHDDFMQDHGIDLRIVRCSSRTRAKAERIGVDDIFVQDAFELINDPSVDIVVELVGGTGAARDYVLAALNAKKHVVTANKALMATYGEEVFSTAERNGVGIWFGASVGGGIPIIGPLNHSLVANKITTVMGIVNGTTNYMLTRMRDARLDYNEALREAQLKGFAEANPTADVDGFDAAAKIAILASFAFKSRLTMDEVFTEGISRITLRDLIYAGQMGYEIKLLAIAELLGNGALGVRVHPALVERSHPLATVDGVYNAIYTEGDFVGRSMFYGEGAGAGPAASAVMGDVVEVAKMIADDARNYRVRTRMHDFPIEPLATLETQYYLRLPVLDRPGVFAKVARVLAGEGISISSVEQHGADGHTADLVVITHKVREDAMQRALEKVSEPDIVVDDAQLIRLVG